MLAHEFGHVFGARAVGGDGQEILMWPLGGLAYVDVPHTPRANFISTAAGPAVNLFLCVLCALFLLVVHSTPLQPHWWWSNGAYEGRDAAGQVTLWTWTRPVGTCKRTCPVVISQMTMLPGALAAITRQSGLQTAVV